MNIVILHCHFERGGVTQVVENHLRFLRQCSEVHNIYLVSGNRISGLSSDSLESATHVCIESMDYDSILNPSGSIEERSAALANQIVEALAAHEVTAADAVLHWHNHSLGKNVAAPSTITKLAAQDWRLLLQVHDFAEDNRPGNYSAIIDACRADSPKNVDDFLYPASDSIHYASLTQADLQVFSQLGMKSSRTHCLPNSVTAAGTDAMQREEALAGLRQTLQLPTDARWCVYPVRGIRRKNVGELLLLSRWLPENTYTGITLRPTTPVETRSYDRWRELATAVAPHAVFDVGHREEISFAQNLAACDYVLSTSVAEGFGIVFLEPWLSGRSVIARGLPTVAKDFQAAGIRFPLLYDSLLIPGDQEWIDSCVRETRVANEQAWASVPADFRPELSWHSGEEGTIDFALLTPKRQTEVLQRLADDSGFERDARQANAELCAKLAQDPDAGIVKKNAQRVRDFYSPDAQGKTLLTAYRSVFASSSGGQLPAVRIATASAIDCVSAMRPLFPCRTEEFSDV